MKLHEIELRYNKHVQTVVATYTDERKQFDTK